MNRKLISRAITATVCSFGISPLAQSAPVLEEVIVTAEKREESLQKVPISIAAFDENTLEKLGVNDIKGLASKVPNVVVNEFTGSSTTVRMFIRGVGQNDVQVTQDPSVALYMDGVYIGSSVGTAFESADIRRVEVLRGPQGTLYGRNATGGAINLITNRADPEEFNFKQRLTAGRYDEFRSRTIVNIPLSDQAAIKLAYSHSERDGFVENYGNGEDWGIEDRDNLTVDLHFSPADNLALDYKFENSSIKDSPRLSQILEWTGSIPGIVGFANPTLKADGTPVDSGSERLDEATSYDLVEAGDVEIDAHTFTVAWDINDKLLFKSITGHRKVDAFTRNSQTPVTFLNGGIDVTYSITDGIPVTDFEQFTQELQLLGDYEQLNWVGGLYYYEDESEENNFGNSNGSEGIMPPNMLVDFTSTENTSIALFGQATWTPASLNDRWHFTLGARYSDDNRKAFRDNNRVSFGFGGGLTTVPAFRANYDRDFDEFNPSFTAEYDVNESSNLYAKVVTAYKSGGTSQRAATLDNFQNGFEPEDLLSYEVGYKADFFDSRMRFNSAIFYMEYDDYQQSVQTGRNAGERDFINIESADIYGLEFDLNYAVTDNTVATLSYGYLDTSFGPSTVTYQRIDESSPTGLSEFTEDLTDELALAPEHSVTVSLDYTRALSAGVLNANINAQYQDESLGGVQEPTGVLNDRTLLAATLTLSEISLGNNAGALRVTLWGKNLLDEEYHIGNIRQGVFDALGLKGLATFGDPRSYGVTAEYEF
jgi:iron complex outermembrane recepter protein